MGALLLAAALAVGAVVVIGDEGGKGGSGSEGERLRAPPRARRGRPGAKLVTNARPQRGWVRHTGPVPILEYHVLGAAPADAPYPELYVSRPDFRRQLDWLERHGYEAVTLDQVQEAWHRGGTLPPKPVVVSFDDGYRPQFTYALPELRRHGWAGVLNLKAEGSDLYPSNVEAMIAAGWELASHTITHPDLTTLNAAALSREVAGSRAILRREYGVPVDNFCYPSGRYDAAVIAAVRAAGYAGATTEVPGVRRPRTPLRAEAAGDPRLRRRQRPRLGAGIGPAAPEPVPKRLKGPGVRLRGGPGCRPQPSGASPRRR